MTKDIGLAKPALVLWLKIALTWQALVLIGSGVYLVGSHHPSGVAWTAPAIGAIVGSALPLQFVVVGIMRAARR
jgi:hypothetical protein